MGDVRITQSVVETIEEDDVSTVRITQAAVETLEEDAVSTIRLTQAVVEVIFPSQTPCATFGNPNQIPKDNQFSGIYFIDPNKTDDTLWTDVGEESKVDVKIPDPKAKIPLLGE